MATPQPITAKASKAEALAYLKATFGNYKYSNDAKTPYQGMDYAQLYAYIAKADPKATPYQIAQTVASLLASSAVASSVGGSVTLGGTAIGEGAIAGAEGVSQFAGELSSPLQFLDNLASPQLWIRVAKVAVGGIVLAIGLAKLTGADQKLGGITAKAVKAAPLL